MIGLPSAPVQGAKPLRRKERLFDFDADRETLPKLQRPHNRIERSLFKIVFWIGGVIVLIVALAIFGHQSIRNWQQRRLSAQANALVDRGDYKRASLDARRLLQINPDNIEGARIMARLAERSGSRTAVEWRQRVVALNAARPDDFFALAQAAIRFDNLSTAKTALEKVPATARNTAQYHSIAADLALAQRDGATMEHELSEAVRLAPTNKEYAFRLAALELTASDSALRERGRESLVALQKDQAFRREATRQLIRDALQRRDFSAAVGLGHQLDNFPDKNFRDRLTLLTVLYEAKDPDFQKLLSELQTAAASAPDSAGALIIWMNAHQMPAEAIAWSKQIRPEALTQRSVSIALADAYITVRDWNGLQQLVKSGNWGEIDFLRSALYARAFRELENTRNFTIQWNEAVKKATPNVEAVLMLSETASKWGWRDEMIDLLWLASKDSVKGEAALQTLYDYFAKSGDTQNLYRVLLHLEELRPNNRDIQNNVAQVSLLLNLNVDHGQKLAHDLYEKEPKNAAYASTYAFALYTQGNMKKAIQVFSGLNDTQLRQPPIAVYYGVLLAGVGDHDRAAQFLDLGDKASLLPEEKALAEKARRSLAQR
jgi:hypothetical protein